MTQRLLEEWKVAQENARHFNDLLLRIRAFGIPVVITIMGAAIAFGPSVTITSIAVRWASIGALGVALLVFLFVGLLFHASRSWPGDTQPSLAEWLELVTLGLVPIVFLAFTGFSHGTEMFGTMYQVTHPVAVGIIGFATSLLAGLYGMDRYYYFALLMGAVRRAEELEPQLGLSLTRKVSETTPRVVAKTVISTIYFLPALMAQLAILILGFVKLWGNTPQA